jgi:hypothetical protein
LKISSRSLRHGIHFLEKRSLSVSRLGDQVAELQKQVAELQAAGAGRAVGEGSGVEGWRQVGVQRHPEQTPSAFVFASRVMFLCHLTGDRVATTHPRRSPCFRIRWAIAHRVMRIGFATVLLRQTVRAAQSRRPRPAPASGDGRRNAIPRRRTDAQPPVAHSLAWPHDALRRNTGKFFGAVEFEGECVSIRAGWAAHVSAIPRASFLLVFTGRVGRKRCAWRVSTQTAFCWIALRIVVCQWTQTDGPVCRYRRRTRLGVISGRD